MPPILRPSRAQPLETDRMNLLLVEDDLDLGDGIRLALSGQGFRVCWVRRLQDARTRLEEALHDVVVLDLGLPDGDGLALLSDLRQGQPRLPVLILSARDGLNDRLRGLDNGADDYLVKPFALAELVARLQALVRRTYRTAGSALVVGGLSVDEAARRVQVDGATVELSRCEFDLVSLLIKRRDHVVSRRLLEEQVLPGGLQSSNSLDVHMSNLRKKIGSHYIRTVRGVGYAIETVSAPSARP